MCRTKVNIREGFSETQKRIALSKTDRRCAHCGKPLDIYHMTVDHCIPLSKGGLNHETNLVALCEDCNKEKSNSVYKPSDYYKYITPYQLESLDKAFDEYIKNNEWFDIQTFFPQDLYHIPNYRPLIRYAKSLKTKDLKVFFHEYASKAAKLGEYRFKRARFKHIHDIEEYITTNHLENRLSIQDTDSTYDWIEFYLKNGSIFTLHQGDRKEIIAVFIFSLECILIKGEETFGVNVHTITDMSTKNYLWIYAYIESIVFKSIAKENQFNHMMIINEHQDMLPVFLTGLIEVSTNVVNNEHTFYRCVSFDKKGRIIESANSIDELPDEIKKGTPYYNRFFEISDITEQKIVESKQQYYEALESREDKESIPDVVNLGILMKKSMKEN